MRDDGAGPAPLEVFYLPTSDGRRFCVFHAPREGAAPGEGVVYVHPFAEEMNKSRRMAALQARALARAGWAVLQVDLAGCGDSEGEFGDASWERWMKDVAEAAAWMHRRTNRVPWLWGLRAGCLVASEAARTMPPVPGLLFWQPVLSGKQFLQQFLRLKIAAQMLEPADAARMDTRELRERLLRGQSIEVAGYELSPGIAAGLEAAELAPVPGASPIAWIEIAGAADAGISPAGRTRADQWKSAGHKVDARCVVGPAFWQTQEITGCPALIEETLAALAAVRS